MTDTTVSSPRTLKVGIWPATAPGGNPFVDRFATELQNRKVEVVDVRSPEDAIGMQIDILHIHWPELVMRIEMQEGKGIAAIALAVRNALRSFATVKRSGVCLVWMVHNITPHDLPLGLRVIWFFYSQRLARLVDAFITLSPATIAVVKRKFRGLSRKPSIGVWHPDFRIELPKDMGGKKDAKRDSLYCSFGLLRPYKGFEELIISFRKFGRKDDRLRIAGQPCSSEFGERLLLLASSDERVEIIFKHLDEVELAVFVSEACAIILPFRRYLHSSTIIYALSAKRPVITQDNLYAIALGKEVGEGWVHTYSGRFDWRKVSRCYVPDGAPRMAAFADGVIGTHVEPFYRSLLK